MGSINFKALGGGAEIATLKASKVSQGDEGDKVIAITVGVNAVLKGSDIIPLLGCTAEEMSGLWRSNKDNDVMYNGITQISSYAEFCGHEVKVSRRKFDNVTLKDFSFKPVAGLQAEVSFKISMVGVPDGDVEFFASLLANYAALKVTGPKELFD